ncbi:type I-E CRISPR-associated protein Cas6/Cse3/CasE [Rhodocaloribacter litoris]|uniref:type I-E CRISPR-associated protein Cas6/Cse3/CasE n=1 Tax=Rhodocaloribacter litoris TaxID=2558931 RepID=UPI00142339EF|nr:type I-E CRISPR-associated protein Cas6/Cse3/CasE [Rhodocaloribacter litoris]QXD16413.1 type I-E CRISPR-associated protein Cas6/Cse3/CasE [Rhodocaloribacter litoris]
MYLSRLFLNPRNPGARRDAARPYELHRTLLRALEHAPDPERLLFRLEPERGPGVPVVLVQTDHTPPDWGPLMANGYLLRADGPKAFEPALHAGQRLRFRLVANPTVKKKVPGKKHGARVPLIHDGPNAHGYPSYHDWLRRRAEQAGFEVLAVQDAPFRTAPKRRKREVPATTYEKTQIPLFGVRFDGVLRVTDPARLAEALRRGIGPAKAFGFGLLSLAPAP